MTGRTRGETAARIREVLNTEGAALNEQVTHHNEQHYAAIENFEEYEEYRTAARKIKERAIDRLPELIDTVRAQVEANGGQVHVARDAAEANQYVAALLESAGGNTVVKSKSMTTEEIGLREHLESGGADVYETDLGEFVVQLADESPSHIVGPALHKSREEIASLFNETFDPPEPLETPRELTAFARSYLGDRIQAADMGITGANFVLAESGTIVLVTNEGNARKSAVVPDTHVAVAGVEKLIPSIGDLHPFMELIARSATGQDIAQYVSLLSPPVDTPRIDFTDPDTPIGAGHGTGDREFHLVLLDNGRMDMRADPQLRETLYCIRCGACLNSCANFQHVGGHAFGGDTYSGGIGTGWVAGTVGTSATKNFNDLCTSCSRCVENCPVKIDIPWINTVVRDRLNRGRAPDAIDSLIDPLVPDEEPPGIDRQKRFFGNIDRVLRYGSALAPLSNWVQSLPGVDRLLESALGIDRRRSLPRFANETLEAWWESRGGSNATDANDAVTVYNDPYTNYLYPERGRAAIRLLEALDIEVTLSPVVPSGRAPLSQGMISTAEQQASSVVRAFQSALAADRPIVVIEPSDVAMFQSEYERLLPEASASRLAEGTQEILEFLGPRLANRADPADFDGTTVLFHSNCQQRAVDLETPTVEAFETLGYDVSTTDVECCGMAGSFGYKEQYYELSMAVGTDLEPELESVPEEDVIASGTSCVAQLGALSLEKEPAHPVERLDRDWSATAAH